jgi:hypothetical protein
MTSGLKRRAASLLTAAITAGSLLSLIAPASASAQFFGGCGGCGGCGANYNNINSCCRNYEAYYNQTVSTTAYVRDNSSNFSDFNYGYGY